MYKIQGPGNLIYYTADERSTFVASTIFQKLMDHDKYNQIQRGCFFREKGNVILTKNELVCRELLLWVLAF